MRIVDVSPDHQHHARLGPIVCRDCPGWDAYRCVDCGRGGPADPLWINNPDRRLRCWDHHTLAQASTPVQLPMF